MSSRSSAAPDRSSRRRRVLSSVLAAAACLSLGCLPPPVPPVAIERATPTDALVRGCAAGQAVACVVAGLRFLKEAPLEPARRIGARRLFERGCVLGRGDACHAGGLLASPIDAAVLHHRACELGVRGGCERNEDLRGRGDPRSPTARKCVASLIDAERARVELPLGFQLPAPLPAAPLPYPMEARAAGFEGRVRLCVTVSPRGVVTDVVVLGDVAVLGDAARAAAWMWRFPPAAWRGVPYGFVVERTVEFLLE